MIGYLVFAGGALFLFLPIILKKGHFLEYYIFFCLYYDVIDVFYVSMETKWLLSQMFIFFVFVGFYTISSFNSIYRIERNFFLLNLFYFLYILLIPLTYGSTIKTNLINLSINVSSFSILYLAYHFYSTKGDIVVLLKRISTTILFSIFIVLTFTLFKIDSNYFVASGKNAWLDVNQLGGILYFGNLGARGFFTYIAFFALLIPAMIYFKIRSRLINYLFFSALLFMMVLSFKRFALATLFIGMLIYFLSGQTQTGFKIRFGFGLVSLLLVLQIFFNFDTLVSRRFEDRGGAEGIGQKAIQKDIRVYELGYVYNLVKKETKTLLFGYSEDLTLNIKNKIHEYEQWTIHNQYAQYLMRYGIIGLVLYFSILFSILNKTRRYFLGLKLRFPESQKIKLLWLVFLMFFISFIFAGMIGGLEKVTIRGTVFIVLGAICGTFYKMLYTPVANKIP